MLDRGAHPLGHALPAGCRAASSSRSTASISITRSITMPMRSFRRSLGRIQPPAQVEIHDTAARAASAKTDEFTQITGSMREGLVLLDDHG
ncbi:MAG: hypothetical protein ACLSHG_13675 [Oscillospiraceae bacterium]